MKTSRLWVLGFILIAIGLVITSVPGIFRVFYYNAFTSPDLLVPNKTGSVENTLLSTGAFPLESNYSIFIGLVFFAAGLVIVALAFFASSPFGLVAGIIGLILFVLPLFLDQGSPSLVIAIVQISGIALLLGSPFVGHLFASKQRRESEAAKVGVRNLFSYAMSHNNMVRDLERKMSRLEEEAVILKSLRDDEGVDSIIKKIEWMSRKRRYFDWLAAATIGFLVSAFFYWLGS